MQCVYIPGKHIYPIDFGESFNLENLSFRLLCSDENTAVACIRHLLNNLTERNLDSSVKICLEETAKAVNLDIISSWKLFKQPLECLCELSGGDICGFIKALDEFYPVTVSAYYEEYIRILQEQISKLLSRNVNN